ncbi:anti-sigma factor [bacterium]|nr:anti-sigma factor [bacterium]
MNAQNILDRFEELEAGRILGDLDSGEIKEWEKLSADPRCKSDLSLELAAAALESEYLGNDEAGLSKDLLGKLQEDMAGFVIPEEPKESEDNVIRPANWQTILAAPKTGWAIAALFALLLIAQSFIDKGPQEPKGLTTAEVEKPSAEERRDTLISRASDLVKSDFGGLESYGEMSGTVVWSDELQEGYMSLTNLAANNPSTHQYQLWIVDPTRDENPVDGGVFDIPSGDGTTIIPIRNPLAITDPKAFVITLEQPGGVVVSKQEVVVALAKAS